MKEVLLIVMGERTLSEKIIMEVVKWKLQNCMLVISVIL